MKRFSIRVPLVAMAAAALALAAPGSASAATRNVSVYVGGVQKASIEYNPGPNTLCAKVYHSTRGTQGNGTEYMNTGAGEPGFAVQVTDKGGDDSATCVTGYGGSTFPHQLTICFVGENGARTCNTGDYF